MDRWKTGVSNSEYLVCISRLSAFREFVVCVVGKMAQYVGMVLCHSHLVWLAFEGSIPTSASFYSENFL